MNSLRNCSLECKLFLHGSQEWCSVSTCTPAQALRQHGQTPYLAIEGRLLVPSSAALAPCCSSGPGSLVPSSQALSPSIPRTTHSEPWLAGSYRTYLQGTTWSTAANYLVNVHVTELSSTYMVIGRDPSPQPCHYRINIWFGLIVLRQAKITLQIILHHCQKTSRWEEDMSIERAIQKLEIWHFFF